MDVGVGHDDDGSRDRPFLKIGGIYGVLDDEHVARFDEGQKDINVRSIYDAVTYVQLCRRGLCQIVPRNVIDSRISRRGDGVRQVVKIIGGLSVGPLAARGARHDRVCPRGPRRARRPPRTRGTRDAEALPPTRPHSASCTGRARRPRATQNRVGSNGDGGNAVRYVYSRHDDGRREIQRRAERYNSLVHLPIGRGVLIFERKLNFPTSCRNVLFCPYRDARDRYGLCPALLRPNRRPRSLLGPRRHPRRHHRRGTLRVQRPLYPRRFTACLRYAVSVLSNEAAQELRTGASDGVRGAQEVLGSASPKHAISTKTAQITIPRVVVGPSKTRIHRLPGSTNCGSYVDERRQNRHDCRGRVVSSDCGRSRIRRSHGQKRGRWGRRSAPSFQRSTIAS